MGTMEFKVNRETFTASQIALDTTVEQAVERDFVLPDYYPDIFRILKCRVIPKIMSHSINGEKMTFELSVLIRVMYQSEGSCKVNCLEQKLNYSKSVDMSGDCQNPMITITPHVDYINCRVVNQRRLDVRGAVSARIKIVRERQQAVIVDAFGANIQLKKSLITYPSKRLTASKRVTVIEELELGASKPAVGAVIRSDCTVFPQEQKMIAGKLITKGDAEISMLYTCIDPSGEDTIESMKFTIPFSQIIDIDGIDESFDAFVDITPSGCEIIPKSENSSALECELVLLVNCTAMKFETCEVVTDAYSTCYECEMENSGCRIESIPVQINETHTSAAQISYDDDEISCIYDCWCDINNISSRYDESSGRYVISGNVIFCLIGKNESCSPIYLEAESPFEHELAAEFSAESTIDPKVCVQSCSYHLTDSHTAELKAELKIGGHVCEQSARNMLCELRAYTDKPKERQQGYALKLCYCSENEDIWEIAKKYSTSINAIMEENDLAGDKLSDCGMLLIPLMN